PGEWLQRNDLVRNVDTAEEPSEVSRNCHQRHAQRLKWQAITRQSPTLGPVSLAVNQPHRPNHQARANPEREVQEKRTLQALALELPLPGKQTSDQHRNGRKRGSQEIAVRGRSQQAPFRPMRQKI